MILKGSQRSGAKALAKHLLNTKENDHVEVHALRGFLSADLTEAFKEIQAISKGTRARQPFFSVSLNPPPDTSVGIPHFEAAVAQIEAELGLADQPRAIVFHEKNGRRHAHVVWSRIDAETMTARPMSHFKTKLNKIARQLFFQHGWQMPRGFLDKSERSPFTVELAEWQAAKRRGKNAIDQRMVIQSCWAASDDCASFAAVLQEHGFRLARGDRRGHVIIAHDGQVLTVARSLGKKAKEVRERLGPTEELPSVDNALAAHRQDVRAQFGRFAGTLRAEQVAQQLVLSRERTTMIATHRADRAALDLQMDMRWHAEEANRSAKIKRGLAGLWQRLTGKRAAILRANAAEASAARERDQNERQALIHVQLKARRAIELKRKTLRRETLGLVKEMRSDRDRLLAALETKPKKTRTSRRKRSPSMEQDPASKLG